MKAAEVMTVSMVLNDVFNDGRIFQGVKWVSSPTTDVCATRVYGVDFSNRLDHMSVATFCYSSGNMLDFQRVKLAGLQDAFWKEWEHAFLIYVNVGLAVNEWLRRIEDMGYPIRRYAIASVTSATSLMQAAVEHAQERGVVFHSVLSEQMSNMIWKETPASPGYKPTMRYKLDDNDAVWAYAMGVCAARYKLRLRFLK